ncbi:MAG: hypothetical protein ACKOUM_04065 [Sphingopyxis sp.]
MKRHHTILALPLLAALVLVAGPSGRIAIQTHDLTDPSPHRIEATFGLGRAALSLLVTWTSRLR